MQAVFKFHICLCLRIGILATVSGKTNYRVVTILDKPYTMVNKDSNSFIGLLPDVLDNIGSYLNVTFNVTLVKDNRYGYQLKNGSWTGMVGELKRNETDIIAAGLTISATRAAHIDFSQPYLDIGLRILVQKPPETSQFIKTASMFFSPFQIGVWIAIIVSYLLVTIVMYTISRFNPEETAKTADDDHIPITTAFFMIFSMLSLQGFRLTPSSASGRILVCFWWFFSIVCICMYTAGLSAQLFVALPIQQNPAKFYTFEQLTNQNEYKYGTLKVGSTFAYFRDSTGNVEQKMYKYFLDSPSSLVSSISEGVQRARDEKYAFIMESETAYYIADGAPCDLMVVGEPLGDKTYGFACRKGTNLCSRLSEAIILMKQKGLLRTLRNKWMSGSCGTYENLVYGRQYVPPTAGDIEDVKRVDIQRFTVPLVLLALGILVAGIFTGIEVMRYRKSGGSKGKRLPEDRRTFDTPADAE